MTGYSPNDKIDSLSTLHIVKVFRLFFKDLMKNMKFFLVNGVQQSHVNIDNRGLAYGDGLFTTAKIVNGHIHYLTAHVERLFFGCEKLGITPPIKEALSQQLKDIAKNYSLAVLKVIITASSGGRGYARASENSYDLIITVHDYPEHYDVFASSGINLGLSSQKLGVNPMLAGLKHLNRLEQVLLRKELSSRVEDDLLVTNINDEVIAATSANVFFYLNGKLHTPDVSESGVNGIMRQVILQRYPDTIIKPITLNDIANAQAMLICNCVMGLVPIASFNGRELPLEQVIKVQKSINKEVGKHD